MEMTRNIGTQAVLWASFSTELTVIIYDLRWMIALCVCLILTDLWVGIRDSAQKGHEVRASRAGRRTCNKMIDYLCYLIVGSLFGLAVFEPLGLCNHLTTAAIGIGLGCIFDLNSIIGHICSIHGMKNSINLWKILMAYLRKRNKEVADVINEGNNEKN